MPDKITQKIESWWREFTAKANDLADLFARRAEWNLPDWMQEHLQGINKHLMWEFGPAAQGDGHRLVITPERRRYLRPLVKQILARAPRLDGWEFYAYRLAEDFEQTQITVTGRTGGDISKTLFRAAVNESNRIDLLFLSRNYQSNEDGQALNDVFVATETLLGEEVLDRWIEAIEVAPLDHGPEEPQSIRNLKVETERLIEQVRNTLPDVPYFRLPDDQKWSGYELKPQQADDYPSRTDMFVGVTMLSGAWLNASLRHSFDSVRFSGHGEVFCYVKTDGSQGLAQGGFADRAEMQDAIDAALKHSESGCAVGGGTGLRYSYVDLALTDVDRGVEVVKRVLRAGNIVKRTWILFFDTDLQRKWIGIWDDTPSPCLADPVDE